MKTATATFRFTISYPRIGVPKICFYRIQLSSELFSRLKETPWFLNTVDLARCNVVEK